MLIAEVDEALVEMLSSQESGKIEALVEMLSTKESRKIESGQAEGSNKQQIVKRD
jgi:hypothetical protein